MVEYKTLAVYPNTLHKMNQIIALNGLKNVCIDKVHLIDELVTKELDKLKEENKND